MNREAEDGWNNTISELDNLTCPIKTALLKMFTAKPGESIAVNPALLKANSHFILTSLSLGNPQNENDSLHKNILQKEVKLIFLQISYKLSTTKLRF